MRKENGDYQAPLAGGGIEDSKAYRRFVASSSADPTDNRAAWSNEMNDAFAELRKHESAGPVEKEEQLPAAAATLKRISSWLLGLCVLQLPVMAYLICPVLSDPERAFGISQGLLAAAVLFYAAIRIYGAVHARNAWIARMRLQEAEKAAAGRTEENNEG